MSPRTVPAIVRHGRVSSRSIHPCRTRLSVLALVALTAPFPAAAAAVDLFIGDNRPAALPGGTATIRLRVGNNGAPGETPIRVTFATPPYVNIDRTRPLPIACVFLYQNLDRTVPEIVQCVLPALATGQESTIVLPISVHSLSPAGLLGGVATVLPTDRMVDTDEDLGNNRIGTSVLVGHSSAPSDGSTNLFVTGDHPAIGGPTSSTQTFVIGNNGPAMTRSPVTLTYMTPFFVIIDRARALPPGCALIFQNLDPGVPELVQCRIPAGLGPAHPQQLRLPLVQIPGAPPVPLAGMVAIRVEDGSGDRDPDRNDNTFRPFTLALSTGTDVADVVPSRADATAPSMVADVESQRERRGDQSAHHGNVLTHGTGQGARVDLTVEADALAIPAGGAGVQRFTIRNQGADATGPVRLVYIVPFFIAIDRTQALPAGCSFLYENADPAVNELVQCIVPGPRQGASVPVDLPVVAPPDAAATRWTGTVIVAPAPGSQDVETFIRDNSALRAILVLRDGPPPVPPGNRIDLYTASEMPNVLTDRPGTTVLTIGNNGSNATRGRTRVTLATTPFVNVDRARPLPAGCGLLYENLDPIVPEVMECVIEDRIAPGAEVVLRIPVAAVPGIPSGATWTTLSAYPMPDSPDVELSPTNNVNVHGVVASQRPPHTLRLFLHGIDTPGTAGGFTMNLTPAPPRSTVSLLGATRWFSEPPLHGTFDEAATFDVVMPCTVGLTVAGTYALAATDLNGGASRPLGQTSQLAALCLLGTHRIRIPVLTPVSLNQERLTLTIAAAIGVTLALHEGASVLGSAFRGTP